jgi:hypothetical protein
MRRRSGERGYILPLAFLVVLLVTGGASAMVMRSATENGAASLYRHAEGALQLAEAGLDQEICNLATIAGTDDVFSGTLPNGTYAIQTPVTVLQPLLYEVHVEGTAPGVQRRLTAVLQVEPLSIFRFAMFGDTGVTVSGSTYIDSFDSRLGPYHVTNNANDEGNIGTNSTTTGALDLNGDDLYVAGQLSVGPGIADPETVVSGFDEDLISGTPPVVSSPDFPLPAVTIPEGLTCTHFSLQGSVTWTLDPGTYCFSELDVRGGATLTSSGPVTIYLSESLTFSGSSTIGVAGNPSQFMFLMASGTSVEIESEITGNSTLYAAMYGPDAAIEIKGDAEIYGSVVGNTVSIIGDAQLHFDEALADSDILSNEGIVTMRFWQEE